MIDFIKIYNCRLDPGKLERNIHLKFLLSLDPESGEIVNKKKYSEFKSIKFSISQVGTVGLSGSLHKYYNLGKHNYNDFNYYDLISSIISLYREFGINPTNCILNNLEFGVNVELPYKPKVLIDGLVTHKYKQFNLEIDRKILYAQVKYENYMLKIYDKGLQYELPENLLRIEIKVLKMNFLKETGIRTLWDLTDYSKLLKLKAILQNTFNEIVFYDETIGLTTLTKREQDLLQEGSNSKFWEQHLRRAGTNASKKMRQYKELIRKYGPYKFYSVNDLIGDKWGKLLSRDPIIVRVLTDFRNEIEEKNVRVLTEIQSPLVGVPLTSTKSKNTSFNNSGIELNVVSGKINKRICQVTGLDISMQKDDSRFLNVTGLRHLAKHTPDLLAEIMKERLSSKWERKPFNIQLREIAHSIRNEYFNPKHNTKRDILKVLSYPSLFNNLSLIKESKLLLVKDQIER